MKCYYFYPRPPRGGRRRLRSVQYLLPGFLPTPSARRATIRAGYGKYACQISTHALREEGDITGTSLADKAEAFLPTPSARRATNIRRP